MEVQLSKWAEYYQSRVNSDRYYNHFEERYKPFLETIVNLEPHEIVDMGCGIGSVSKYLKTKGIECFLIDKDSDMMDLALENNKHWITPARFMEGDMLDGSFNFRDTLCVTHGVLEHYNNVEIWKAVQNMPYSIHYVPLEGWEKPSFGDERLMPKEFWISLLDPVKWGTFNDDKDMWFLIKR